jgi:hypothetical protein
MAEMEFVVCASLATLLSVMLVKILLPFSLKGGGGFLILRAFLYRDSRYEYWGLFVFFVGPTNRSWCIWASGGHLIICSFIVTSVWTGGFACPRPLVYLGITSGLSIQVWTMSRGAIIGGCGGAL